MTKSAYDIRKGYSMNKDVEIMYNSFEPEKELMDRLARQRRALGITQLEVAKKMKTSPSSVSRLESGGGKAQHSPSLRTLRSYAYAINQDFDLLFWTMDEEAAKSAATAVTEEE